MRVAEEIRGSAPGNGPDPHADTSAAAARGTDGGYATPPSLNPNLTPTTADDLMRVMQEMMHLQSQQLTQMLQQVVQVTQAPPAQVAPAPAPPPSTYKKIHPTLPEYDGNTDTDNHMDLFESIAETEGWTDDDRKQNLYKTLVKTAKT